MSKDSFTQRLREMYPVNADYRNAFRDADEFVEYWCGEVLKRSGGTWDYQTANEVMTLVVISR